MPNKKRSSVSRSLDTQHGTKRSSSSAKQPAAAHEKSDDRQYGTTDGSVDYRTDTERFATIEASSASEEIRISLDSIRFDVLRNALMHTMRQRHFDFLHRWLMFCIVLMGTAGVGNFFEKWVGRESFAALTAILATLDLVLDLRGKASLHSDLRRRYYLLLAEIENFHGSDAAKLCGWQAEMIRITADEPDLYQVVDCLAYNRALYSLGRDERSEFVIPWWRRKLANFATFGGYNPPIRGELNKQ